MPDKNMKITTKLTICTMIFLLPLGIMLYSIISFSVNAIRKDERELNGITVLRPAVSLMQIVPQFIRLSVDRTPGDMESMMYYTADLLKGFTDEYGKHFGMEPYLVTPDSLFDSWRIVSGGGRRDEVLWSYAQLISNMHRIIIYIGDISGLVTGNDIENFYLVSAAAHDLTQVQERIVLICNLLRAWENGEFTQRRRAELDRHLELLVFSDNSRIKNSIDASETLRMRNVGAGIQEMFETYLQNCYNAILYFFDAVHYAVNTPDFEIHAIPVLYEAAANANNAAYRLQEVSLDRLETLVTARIQENQQNLVLSLALAFAAALAAFTIVFVITSDIRRSTQSACVVFKSLEENDLTTHVEVMTRDEFGEMLLSLGAFLEKIKTNFALFNRDASIISTSVYDLSSSAREIAATANAQSASVAEIVSTMENNNKLSEQVTEKTVEVAELAAMTEELSLRGADLYNANEFMMAEIRDQNAKIVDEIKNLTEVLSHINESVRLIDSIADKTKLIAFNATLEASSSGEAGLRFAVVAGEIRRFADNVVESVVEIKERISELQDTSKVLISKSDAGFQVINSGYIRMVEQKDVFQNIVDASQNVASRSQQISNLSKQQELATAQVFSALKEISAGVRQFVTATASTSTTADNLNRISHELKEILGKYRTSEQENV